MELTSVLPERIGISLMGPETLCSSPPSRGSSAARLAIDTIYGQNVSPLFPEGLTFAPIPLYPPKSNRLHRKPPPRFLPNPCANANDGAPVLHSWGLSPAPLSGPMWRLEED